MPPISPPTNPIPLPPAPPPQTTPPALQPIPPLTSAQSSKKKSLKWIIAAVIIVLLGVAIFYFKQSVAIKRISDYEDCIANKTSIIQESFPAVCVTKAGRSFIQPISEEEKQKLLPPSPDPTANWKTYNGKTLSFKYPVNWSVKEEYSEYFSGEIVSIDNPTKTVSIEVTPRGQPYGFGPRDGFKESQIKLTIDGKEYLEKETVIDNRTAFVDFSIQTNGKEYFILFGTGYPVNDDQKASIVDYNQEKNVIIQILSTFKFMRQNDLVWGIQINTCCSCPTKVNKSTIGTDGWVLYEKGKNYSSLLPDECKRVDCAPCPPLEETSASSHL